MMRARLMLRVLAFTASAAVVSCTSALHEQTAREETRLSARENHHLAVLLEDMAAGWDGMHHGKAGERHDAEVRYESALAKFLREWDHEQSPRYWQNGAVFATPQHAFRIEFDATANEQREVPPSQIDELLLTSRVKRHAEDTLAQRPGVGVPVVGHIKRTSSVRQQQPFLPPNGGNLTLTAILEMADAPAVGTPRRCRLRLHNALNVDAVKVRNEERQLAANFTAAKQLALSKGMMKLFSLIGILYPDRMIDACQLYRIDVYDPHRIPVVFVHGLMSDPHIWLNIVNAISADPELRAAYQPWYFLYPTAIGVPQAAERLRTSLHAAREHFDPDHNDPGMNQMVLVGHSMGGLLGRMQTIDPGDQLWNSMFNKPPQELNVAADTRERLVRMLKFKPEPEIKRLVFITTPHRGSNFTGRSIVRGAASIIRVPLDTLRMTKQLLSGNTGALSPQLRDWGCYAFLSLGTLSDKHPFYQGLNAVPIPVPHHSIIGDFGRNNSPNSSDAIVPYRSSHLDSAQSEKIVPYWHACTERPEVVREIVRVLREHLRANGLPSKQRS